jgi:hypothetical protein
MVCCIRDLQSKQVVHLVFSCVVRIIVSGIRRDGTFDESMSGLHAGWVLAWKIQEDNGAYLLMTYGGYVKLRLPGVGSVRPFVVVVGTGIKVVLDSAEAWDEDAAAADDASVALDTLNPSGYK